MVPRLVGHRQRRACLLRGIRHATDPADPRRTGTEPRDGVGTVQTAVGDEERGLLLGRMQLVRQRLHGRHQADRVAGIPIERVAEQGHVSVPGGRQRQHPLFAVGAVRWSRE
jgi:hypothetical protein